MKRPGFRGQSRFSRESWVTSMTLLESQNWWPVSPAPVGYSGVAELSQAGFTAAGGAVADVVGQGRFQGGCGGFLPRRVRDRKLGRRLDRSGERDSSAPARRPGGAARRRGSPLSVASGGAADPSRVRASGESVMTAFGLGLASPAGTAAGLVRVEAHVSRWIRGGLGHSAPCSHWWTNAIARRCRPAHRSAAFFAVTRTVYGRPMKAPVRVAATLQTCQCCGGGA